MPGEGTAVWRLWVDTGGTFTDCLALDPTGRLHRAKVLSTSAVRGTVEEQLDDSTLRVTAGWPDAVDLVRGFAFAPLPSGRAGEGAGGDRQTPGLVVAGYDPVTRRLSLTGVLRESLRAGDGFELRSPEEAPILAARIVTATPGGQPLPPLTLRLATTRGTNALLERKGAPLAFFVTRGFADLVTIGTQQRPDLFALRIERPEPLYTAVVEVDERLAADGTVLSALDLASVRPHAEALLARGVRVATVALMHSYRDDAHEAALEEALLSWGFDHVSRSSAVAPAINLLHRAETALADGYLTPVLSGYLRGVADALEGGDGEGESAPLHVMTSAGGLVRPADFRPKDSLLSGPAGGVVGASSAGHRSGFERVIAFDMGGTSTDVARYDGDYEYVWQHSVAGVRLLAPALAIESVAAGGGSVCAIDANGLRVGPQSAGAYPGPACYNAGGPLTITDCNLLLGRLDADRFGIPISQLAAAEALELLRAEVNARTGEAVAAEPLLAGLLEIADERMADAIRGISLRRGYDPAEYALVVFGGAGGQHGCGVARRLGIRSLVVPPDASLLSAWGLSRAVVERFAERQVLRPLDEVDAELPVLVDELARSAVAAIVREGVDPGAGVVRRRIANLRFLGQDATLPVDVAEGSPLADAFAERYRETFGHLPEARPIEVESLRVIASSTPPPAEDVATPSPVAVDADRTARVWVEGAWREVPAYERERLPPGARFAGPCLVTERHSVTFVDAGWDGRIDGAGAITLSLAERDAPETRGAAFAGSTPEAVREELFTSRFEALVGEMGDQLRRTALSTNVKERLDFSCALLDPGGHLVANAPHIPVHLGALGLCVRAIRTALELSPGDVVVTNHPGFGGSHLPDVTVVTPVHGEAGELLGYVASRAHHAEIGGSRPGSMPPSATTLAEEGVVIPPTLLVAGGEGRWEGLREMLAGGPYPSRTVEDNLADLRAQVAANHRGAGLLRSLARVHGSEAVARYMEALTGRAERRIREALKRVGDGRYDAVEQLDDGAELRVRIEVTGDAAVLDFRGTSGVHPGNLNATPAIVRSAVLYVLRLLVDEPLPLNEGLLQPVEIRLPTGLLSPFFPDDAARAPAVVGGNTEVSQRLVDTLLKALRLCACSQGTMNNVLWGNDRFAYYETVCGGTGGGPDFHGCDAVHSHMTNTRITDPEVVEHRFPVRIERFGVRRGSGGAGAWGGGDGAIREVTFLESMSLSVLTQHRVVRPYGMEGGGEGMPGRQRVIRASGDVLHLASVAGCEVEPGDRLLLETPGGGAWGEPAV